ncbi:hydantoinase B/oxoprolinase family protein [Falsiroseomonas oryzae]|uniref:hydantoinase B/oxoprolinase family protein n=1 Tax=Falsiroseomonas oryzae TaxID=2766473 RepID=UPI0022EB9108|nr:hydantoinase B/oxoprolinase family protein [Roseomonas sp. MO-31]
MMADAADRMMVEIVAHRLQAAAEEMMATLVRTAYSPNIKERRDCSVGIFDARGQLLALTAIAPLHLSSLLGLVEHVTRRFPLDTLQPGDGILANDPYNGGGSHLPDLTIATPVFADGQVIAFVCNIAHHSDVGGRVPGSESADCTSIYQEGLRLPPVRLVAAGEVRQDIVEIVLLNSRTPGEREGDLKAQIATNATGVRRMEALVARFGREATLAAFDAILAHGEARARAAITALPRGSWTNEEVVDNDGLGPADLRARVTVTAAGDTLRFDFAGTDPQMRGARNMVLGATLACVYYAVKALVDPDLPPNAGTFRPIEVVAPAGSLLNATQPAAVGDRSSLGNVVGDLIFGAFAQAVPERVMAGCGPLAAMTFSGVDPRSRRYFVDYETYAGAAGAQHDQDGKDAVRVHISGAANLPVEAAEHEFPLAVLRYELIADSGGAGTFRGGLGTRRDVQLFAEEGRLVGRALRQVAAPRGHGGGHDGTRGRFVMRPGAEEAERLPASFSDLPIGTAEVVRIETSSGAGFGDPAHRDPALVLADVLDGKVSAAAARALYRVAIRDGAVDAAATAELRA